MKHAPWATKARWSGAWPGVATTVSGPKASPSPRRTSAAWRLAPTGGSVPAAAFRSAMPSAWSAWSWVSAMPPIPPRSRASARTRSRCEASAGPGSTTQQGSRPTSHVFVPRSVYGDGLSAVICSMSFVASGSMAAADPIRSRRRRSLSTGCRDVGWSFGGRIGTPNDHGPGPSPPPRALPHGAPREPTSLTPPPPSSTPPPGGNQSTRRVSAWTARTSSTRSSSSRSSTRTARRGTGTAVTPGRSGRRGEPVDRPAQRHDVHVPRPSSPNDEIASTDAEIELAVPDGPARR